MSFYCVYFSPINNANGMCIKFGVLFIILDVFNVAKGMWTQIISGEISSDYIQSFRLMMQPPRIR
jgi:hypothetical protein